MAKYSVFKILNVTVISLYLQAVLLFPFLPLPCKLIKISIVTGKLSLTVTSPQLPLVLTDSPYIDSCYTSLKRSLSSVLEVAVVDRFNCIYLSSRVEAERFQLTVKSTRHFVFSDDVGV